MPRSMQETIDDADELAARFEHYEPAHGDRRDAATLRELRAAVLARTDADRAVVDAVTAARNAGHSWTSVGAMLGTSGEAVRQRFSALVRR